MKFSPADQAFIQEKLLTWFEKNQRPLPWRKNYLPYEVWISEIMLQQTQVATALPYFERWMEAFPTVSAVAEASEEELLKLWEGLGYYSRARNIQKMARILLSEHGGKLPSDYETLLGLPGIGPYTAAALCSIAFQQDHAVVDGNVVRVLARLSAFEENVRSQEKLFWKAAQDLLPPGKARFFNQAMMEFGALQCLPKNPHCSTCPLQSRCKAYAGKLQEDLPFKGPSSNKVPLQVALAVIQKEGRVFIQKRRAEGLMGGLWEFPGGKVEAGERPETALHREIKEELGISIQNLRFHLKIRHNYTKYKVELHCFLADYEAGKWQLKAASDAEWVTPEELRKFPFPAANLRLIQSLFNR